MAQDNQQNRGKLDQVLNRNQGGGAPAPLDSSQKPVPHQSEISQDILKELPPKLLNPGSKESVKQPFKPNFPPTAKTTPNPSSKPSSMVPNKPAIPKPSDSAVPYRSSIRTMESDIAELKKGKTPSGKEIQVKPQAPSPQAPSPPDKPLPSPPLPPESAKNKISPDIEIKLGEPKKSGGLSGIPPIPPAGPPGGPSVKMPEGPKETPSQFAIPSKKKRFSKFFLIIVVIGVVAIGALAFLLFRQGEGPIVSEPPITTPTPPPLPKLSEILGTTEEIIIDSTLSAPNQQLLSNLSLINLPASSFKVIKLKDEFGAEYNFSRFLDDFQINFFPDLMFSLDITDWSLFVFGQSEEFDSSGILTESMSVTPVLGFSVKVNTKQSARSSLNIWEGTMNSDLKDLFGYNPSDATLSQYSDSIYRGTSIRYTNFPYPDETVDYVILKPFFAGDKEINYLIFTNSRENMYGIIDTLGGI